MKEIKDGYKTSEFWISVGTAVVGLLMQFNAISAGEGESIMAVIVTVAPLVAYILSRAYVKK